MEVEEPVHFTNFELHNYIEKGAAEFLGAMLREIRKTFMYGNMTWIAGQYQPHPDESFKMLGAISNYIQMQVASGSSFPNKIHFDFFEAFDLAISDPEKVAGNVLNGKIRNGIICFIWRLHDCIRFVQGASQAELEHILEYMHTNYYRLVRNYEPQRSGTSLRASTKASTWSSTVNQWKEAVGQWTNFLSIYDSVFPRVFWDIPGTMQFMIEHYPKVFWKVFWPYVGKVDSFFTYFRNYLVRTVVPALLKSDKDGHQLNLSDQAFHQFLSAVQHTDFATVMKPEALQEAMAVTQTVLFPRSEELGADTRSGMDMDMSESARRRSTLYMTGQVYSNRN